MSLWLEKIEFHPVVGTACFRVSIGLRLVDVHVKSCRCPVKQLFNVIA